MDEQPKPKREWSPELLKLWTPEQLEAQHNWTPEQLERWTPEQLEKGAKFMRMCYQSKELSARVREQKSLSPATSATCPPSTKSENSPK